MNDEHTITILELRVTAAVYLLEHENLDPERRLRLIEFLERVATGDELVLIAIDNNAGDYNGRDFEDE